MPRDIVSGYGKLKTEVAFNFESRNPSLAGSSFGDEAKELDIGNFYFGVVGDFKDWDMTVDVFVAQWKPGMPPLKTDSDLAKYVGQFYSKKWTLKDGKEVSNFGGLANFRIGRRDVVVATAADLYRITPIVLESGGKTTLRPYQQYFLRLNDRVGIGLRFFHWNLKKLTPQRHAEAQTKAIAIIERIRETPRP